jgi:phage baseplate assembly protein W
MDQSLEKAFLGRGWAFPVAAEPGGEVALVAHEEDIRESIRIILGTNHGERVMRPDFGANLRALVFEPLSATTLSLAQDQVERALIEWEPRIDLLDVRVTADAQERARGRLTIEIDYRVRATNTFYNLVYPFYLLEGTAT